MDDVKKSYWNPVRRVLQNGAAGLLGGVLEGFHAKKILLVMGERSFRGSEHYKRLKENLRGISADESAAVGQDPTIAFIKTLYETHRSGQYDAVVGVGGGSVLDVSKLMAVLLAQKPASAGVILDGASFPDKRLPLVLLPTTSGTGSEVTPNASVTNDQKRKISLQQPCLFADVALIDPVLTYSMPSAVTAATGFDALSQAIESFWSVNHGPFSDTHALKAVSLIVPNLLKVIRDPHDAQARFAMSEASCEAGLAIAQTKTTAVHSVSYPITTFFGVPHGHACALTLAQFMRFNEDAMHPERYRRLWAAMGVSGASAAAELIERLMGDVKLEKRLSRLGIDESGVEKIIENGFRPDRIKNNPKPVTSDSLRSILQKIY